MEILKRLWPLFDTSITWKGWASLLTLSALATTTWKVLIPLDGDSPTPTAAHAVVPIVASAAAMEPFELVGFDRAIDPATHLPLGEPITSGETVMACQSENLFAWVSYEGLEPGTVLVGEWFRDGVSIGGKAQTATVPQFDV